MVAIEDRMREILFTPGVSRVGLVRLSEEREIAVEGTGAATPAPEVVALLRAVQDGLTCADGDIEQVVITEREHHLLLAPLHGGEFCVQVRMERSEGHLGLVMHRLRELASAAVPAPPAPHRRRPPGNTPIPGPRARVDRTVLNRVLDGLRELCVDGPPTPGAMTL